MTKKDLFFHKSVLVSEMLQYLNPVSGGVYVDATFGSGGHTRAILESNPDCTVVGIDWDEQSLETYVPLIEEQFGDRFIPIWGNFAHLYKLLKKNGITKVDGIIADFGTSQMQIMERPGFSFSRNTPLDMRMSRSHHRHSAADVINSASEQTLTQIFKEYGEERFARKIAYAIVTDRKKKRFKTTTQLSKLIERIVPNTGKIHPATRVFQALRIYVNKELDHIQSFLAGVLGVLKKEGRIVCISFHSLEDRIVKQFFRKHADLTQLEILTPKIVSPSESEIETNPSSRSAKLRAAKKIS